MERPARILVVDDVPTNISLLQAVLAPRGYEVLAAANGQEALETIGREKLDLVLLDIQMPGLDGYEVCRRIRADPETCFLPVVMVTASVEAEKVRALEAGADDFIRKPLDQEELLARVKSLIRIQRYHETIDEQSRQLLELNQMLEAKVADQVGELERMARLRRFLSPQVVDLVLSAGDDTILTNHRREIAVVFFDLRGFTPFAGSTEPEQVMELLNEFYQTVGEQVAIFGATVGNIAGDGLMLFFNDPVPCEDPGGKAVRMALVLNECLQPRLKAWRRRGHDLGLGTGIDLGYATLGRVGFEGRYDYGAIGNVVNMASRLCDEAKDGQILLSQRAYIAVEGWVEAEELGLMSLKGFDRPVTAWNVVSAGESSFPAIL